MSKFIRLYSSPYKVLVIGNVLETYKYYYLFIRRIKKLKHINTNFGGAEKRKIIVVGLKSRCWSKRDIFHIDGLLDHFANS